MKKPAGKMLMVEKVVDGFEAHHGFVTTEKCLAYAATLAIVDLLGGAKDFERAHKLEKPHHYEITVRAYFKPKKKER